MSMDEKVDSIKQSSQKRILELIEIFLGCPTSARVESINEALFNYVATGSQDKERVIEMTQELTETVNFIVGLQEEFSFYQKMQR